MPDTWMRRAASPRSRAHAPPPRHAHQRSSSAGADRTRRLELAVALDREQRPEQGHAADEVVGAVDRVDVPADRRVGGLAAVLLADEAVIRERVEEAPADHPLDLGVGLGHERLVGLGRDLEVAPEMPPRHEVRLVAGGERDVQPAAQLGVRTAPEPGRPFRAEARRRIGHARILAPVGSYSGSRATSKPIQSPKTSTSPRVPIAARSGGR